LRELQLAAEKGWAEYPSSSNETVIAFHPALLPTYFEYREIYPVPAKAVVDAIEASGLNDPVELSNEERARRATFAVVRSSTFARSVVQSYEDLCAMCGLDFGLVQAAHILPATAPGSIDEPWNGVALCSNHHGAFDRYFVWVDPDSREIVLHPNLHNQRRLNRACDAFVETTFSVLREPAFANARPRREMFLERYSYFKDQYSWAD
jgi:putative restriction endonuclease